MTQKQPSENSLPKRPKAPPPPPPRPYLEYAKQLADTQLLVTKQILSKNDHFRAPIVKAILRAYDVLEQRNWDTVYWAIDLHGVVFNSTYTQGGYEFINDDCRKALQLIASLKETKLILWSSCHKQEQPEIIEFFKNNSITVHYFNENPEVGNTLTGNFEQKFYFSVLLDDKAGFDPAHDWSNIVSLFENNYV